MSRYKVQKYVDCTEEELKARIKSFQERGYNIEYRADQDIGSFIVAKKDYLEIYIGYEKYPTFEELKEKEADQA